MVQLGQEIGGLLDGLGVDRALWTEGSMPSVTPLTGEQLGMVRIADAATIDTVLNGARAAFRAWRTVPAPRRGELVRLWGEELRAAKDDLAKLVTIEAGKIASEGAGEVQEMIDICDFALGLSRQLYGLTIATERPGHRMMEVWHPLGVVGVISAFNFPVAVWAWNAALALVCGNSVVWKPSEKTPLTALATQAIFERAVARFGDAPEGLSQLLIGGREAGEALVDDRRVALVSATGSTRMGRAVAPRLAQRFARAILELGGNNGVIVAPSADLDLALRGVAFGAMGTAGQRCTTTRRLFLHDGIYDGFVERLKAAYASVGVGNPLAGEVLVGPLIDRAAYEMMQGALAAARAAGGVVHGGERVGEGESFYVRPALVEMPAQIGPVLEETFAPILYVMRYDDLDAAIEQHNDVAAGLSSAIFTTDMREAERFLAASDCGIANVNLGTSGAEIGGAFGGEKETGGGRESGSDSWKAYMRRATNTVNYSDALPLAQGVSFEV
ncbi:putative aldehyde dehydrogenase family 7 member A1 homolog [uncultured Sphingopyxis sp.]|uniref:Putative aldehyde dehydrogenase family 7 member A1 homolog n=1 Tax=uncultured Sphingopyxis sp. TaxID=310581 RepID=A0A1Y5PVD4_9SPHN|nr:aldehyde dehydrogenase family protein [uncultured Sphingopyxis sp.]SBV33982.1 putative aldehyde dehydrogenase family 7 member A1 homolog [uncultured Sphingopyxis sp.]